MKLEPWRALGKLELVLPVLLVLLHAMVLLELESLARASGTEGCWEVECDVAGCRVSERIS